MLIIFEGIDGSGKTTQAKLLAEYLQAQGSLVLLTREPGGTPLAENIRELLLTTKLEAKEQLLLIVAARFNHYYQQILPALAKGKIVICDRFVFSTLAYQGYGMGLDLELIKDIHQQFFLKETKNEVANLRNYSERKNNEAIENENKDHCNYCAIPYLTIILDVVPKAAKKMGVDIYEQQNEAFFQRVAQGYRALGHGVNKEGAFWKKWFNQLLTIEDSSALRNSFKGNIPLKTGELKSGLYNHYNNNYANAGNTYNIINNVIMIEANNRIEVIQKEIIEAVRKIF